MGAELGIMVKAIIWPLARLASFTALVKGSFLWLEQGHKIYIDRWVASMIGAAESMAVQAPSWIGWVLAGGGGLLVMAIWQAISHRMKQGGMKPSPISECDTPPVGSQQTRIVLSDAAMEAYEQTEQTTDTQALGNISRFNRSTLLGFMAQKLVNESVAVFGRCPPSDKHKKIPADHAASYQFNDEATKMYDIYEPKNHYVDLEIMRGDLERRIEELLAAPVILAELETTVAPIDGLTPACAIRITNSGPELECLVQIEDHGSKVNFPDPLVIRSAGQIIGNRTSRFTLSKGQSKLIPILFKIPAHLGHFRFIGEDGGNYDFVIESLEFVVAIYSAGNPTKVRIRLSNGQDFKPEYEMEYC